VPRVRAPVPLAPRGNAKLPARIALDSSTEMPRRALTYPNPAAPSHADAHADPTGPPTTSSASVCGSLDTLDIL